MTGAKLDFPNTIVMPDPRKGPFQMNQCVSRKVADFLGAEAGPADNSLPHVAAKTMLGVLTACVLSLAGANAAYAQEAEPSPGSSYWRQSETEMEDFVPELMPAGIGVEIAALDGPVFTNVEGMTLYTWPLHGLRNGDVGDRKGVPSSCTDHLYTENSGLMSPYPAGFLLPDLETRPTCIDLWPPLLAEEGAEPIGKWTIIERTDGGRQWAYDGFPIYTSVLDERPGDVYGGEKRRAPGDGPAVRIPIGPAPNVPPEFQVVQVANGRMLTDHTGYSVYASDGDDVNTSNCYDACLEVWEPVLAPERALPRGEWSVVERAPGIKQWAFRGEPLYTYINDPQARGVIGSDVPGWHNVYTQKAPAPPSEFTIQNTRTGQVLADSDGKTVYIYNCGDDALDQLYCDHPDATQAYRTAVCGGNDPERCLATFPPVEAPGEVETGNRLWGTAYIDPLTGREVEFGQDGGMNVWTYRDRPIYTFAGDQEPGDINADNWGEFNGLRNGFKAFWLRDDYFGNTL
jgi:predicted lipoprotein with Yx(FWY)xxD motif